MIKGKLTPELLRQSRKPVIGPVRNEVLKPDRPLQPSKPRRPVKQPSIPISPTNPNTSQLSTVQILEALDLPTSTRSGVRVPHGDECARLMQRQHLDTKTLEDAASVQELHEPLCLCLRFRTKALVRLSRASCPQSSSLEASLHQARASEFGFPGIRVSTFKAPRIGGEVGEFLWSCGGEWHC